MPRLSAKILAGLQAEGYDAELRRRMGAGDLINGSITCSPGIVPGGNGAGGLSITFTYKTASIIGELGRNVRELRTGIARDRLFQAFARLPVAFETAFAHTRWASVGSITEENCHPLSNFTLPPAVSSAVVPEKYYPAYGMGPWTLHVVLNGDIDNYQTLRRGIEAGGELIAPEVTTDTKIIPLQIEKYLLLGHDLTESFRLAVCDFEGSHAIAMVSSVEPGKAFLALKGSGQSIYVGIAPDRYLFSSELYGLVEETPSFVKMDGEKPARPDQPETTGQIFILDQEAPGGIAGIRGLLLRRHPASALARRTSGRRRSPHGISIGAIYPHYFLKEITEAVHSVRKTLRGKVPHRTGSGGGEGRLQPRRGHHSRKDQGGPDRRGDPADHRHRSWNGGRRRKRRGRRDREPPQGKRHPRGGPDRLRAERVLSGEGPARHPSHSDHPVGDDDRHQPRRGHGRGAGRRRDCHREPAPVRHHDEGRRRLLHLRRPGHRDGRRLDEGLLLPDRGRPHSGPLSRPCPQDPLQRADRDGTPPARADAGADAEGPRQEGGDPPCRGEDGKTQDDTGPSWEAGRTRRRPTRSGSS